MFLQNLRCFHKQVHMQASLFGPLLQEMKNGPLLMMFLLHPIRKTTFLSSLMVIFHIRLAVPATHVLLYISLVTGPGTFAAAACHGISAAWIESARISLDTLREMHGILLFLYLYFCHHHHHHHHHPHRHHHHHHVFAD